MASIKRHKTHRELQCKGNPCYQHYERFSVKAVKAEHTSDLIPCIMFYGSCMASSSRFALRNACRVTTLFPQDTDVNFYRFCYFIKLNFRRNIETVFTSFENKRTADVNNLLIRSNLTTRKKVISYILGYKYSQSVRFTKIMNTYLWFCYLNINLLGTESV